MDNSVSAPKRSNESLHWAISEIALYAFLYYVQFLLGVETNLWLSSLILWILLNLSIVFCPVIRRCSKK